MDESRKRFKKSYGKFNKRARIHKSGGGVYSERSRSLSYGRNTR